MGRKLLFLLLRSLDSSPSDKDRSAVRKAAGDRFPDIMRRATSSGTSGSCRRHAFGCLGPLFLEKMDASGEIRGLSVRSKSLEYEPNRRYRRSIQKSMRGKRQVTAGSVHLIISSPSLNVEAPFGPR